MRNASKSVAWERIIAPATLLLVSLLAAGPLWGAGFLNTRGGGDSPFLLLRTHQLAANLRAGVFPARWMPDAAYGFGYPFFSYYAALPYYVAAGFEILGLGILTAIKLTQTLFLGAAALAMYRWAEQVLDSRPGAWLAAVAYTSAPFHLVNLYVRGDSLSEFAAFAFYPLILWGFDRLAAQPSLRRALFPALAYAGLIVTHNVSALIFSPFILLYVALHVVRLGRPASRGPLREAVPRALLLVLPLLVALLLSAWFWLPALAETRYVQLNAQTSGYFFYGNHFRDTDLVQGKLPFDYTTGQEEASPFAMGLLQTIVAVAGALVVCLRGMRARLAVADRNVPLSEAQRQGHGQDTVTVSFALMGLVLSTWLITPLSQPLWDHLPLLPMVQFPWRFLSIQALFAALLTGAIISHLRAQQRRLAWTPALVLGALLTVAALAGLEPDYLPISDADVTTERLQLYELFTGNIGSTIRHEYLPRWVNPRPYIGPQQVSPDIPARAIPVSGALISAERLRHAPTHRIWRVETGSEGAEVAFPLYYWPGWHAVVDGEQIEVGPTADSGYLSLRVPPGSHRVEMRLGNTPLRLGANVVSLVAVLMTLALWIRGTETWKWNPGARHERRGEEPRNNRRGGERQTSATGNLRAAISYLPFVTMLSLLIAFHPRVESTTSHDLAMDFESMPYLHHNPDGIPLGEWQLTSYHFQGQDTSSSERVSPGNTLEVTVAWRRGEDLPPDVSAEGSLRLQLVPPAAVRQAELPALAKAPIELNQGQATAELTRTASVTLPIPRDTAPGIHLIRLVDGPTVYLRPVWIDHGPAATPEPVQAVFADGAVHLHHVQVDQTAPDRLDVQLDWSAVKPIAANYGLSLSLTDTAGNEWLSQGERPGYDAQPGGGFLPTSLWPLNRLITDRHSPAVLPGVPPGDAYTLTVDLYRVATWQSVGRHTVTVPLTETTVRSDAPTLAHFGEELALSRLETSQSVAQGEELETTTYWLISKKPSADYLVDWQLEGPAHTITATQPMAPGSAPKAWPAGAWIAGRTSLPVPPTTPPGDYTLSISLKEPGDGTLIGSYTHPTLVAVRERDRVWEIPPMDIRVGARFGDMIELAGYDLRQRGESLRLTLYWQAVTTPDRHYMLFVHLADPQTGEPVSQVDTMPQGFTYPTGQWAPGEVVTDEVELSTKGVASGRYDLAVGWYDPDTRQRLPVVDSEGKALPDGRLVLPSSIVLP